MLNKPDSTRVACLSDEYVMHRNNASSLHIVSCLATRRHDQEEHHTPVTSRLLLRCVCVCAPDLGTRYLVGSLLCPLLQSHSAKIFSFLPSARFPLTFPQFLSWVRTGSTCGLVNTDQRLELCTADCWVRLVFASLSVWLQLSDSGLVILIK
jgi:hypothetical protein